MNEIETSRVFSETAQAFAKGFRYIINKGGARSGKTFSILQFFLFLCMYRSLKITVTSRDLPHLKKGALSDWKTILTNSGAYELFSENKSDHIFINKTTGAMIEFTQFASAEVARGPQRDILFVNECNNVPFPICDQLFTRTSKAIFLDYNPVAAFWVDDNLLQFKKDKCKVIHSTYKDNVYLSPEQVYEIESHRSDKNWWRVYGLGEIGFSEGAIYSNWDEVEASEAAADSERTFVGIDFGYINDPTAIIRVTRRHNDLYLDLLEYSAGLQNYDIAKTLKEHHFDRATAIVADSAEVKSIDEINSFGFHVIPVQKGNGSILEGINMVKRFNLHVIKSAKSNYLCRELRNYVWLRDRNDSVTNRPLDAFNHALDALRYVCFTYFSEIRKNTTSFLSDI